MDGLSYWRNCKINTRKNSSAVLKKSYKGNARSTIYLNFSSKYFRFVFPLILKTVVINLKTIINPQASVCIIINTNEFFIKEFVLLFLSNFVGYFISVIPEFDSFNNKSN